ncbi:unnamed protein product [Ostreobium quekettii]|uniref:Uncharacterized protein n=1 Tax=Ostreobium quekettii TaxID=121088 RepID=A0A8S1J5M2_9CHLO|nr:unnamed protein product [Ostreobium quekettii]
MSQTEALSHACVQLTLVDLVPCRWDAGKLFFFVIQAGLQKFQWCKIFQFLSTGPAVLFMFEIMRDNRLISRVRCGSRSEYVNRPFCLSYCQPREGAVWILVRLGRNQDDSATLHNGVV